MQRPCALQRQDVASTNSNKKRGGAAAGDAPGSHLQNNFKLK